MFPSAASIDDVFGREILKSSLFYEKIRDKSWKKFDSRVAQKQCKI